MAKTERELVEKALEVEALLLESLGRHEEAATARARNPLVRVGATEQEGVGDGAPTGGGE